jgi:hypothetical protein
MFTVTSNPDRNRLYITLAGYLEGPERQAVMKAIMAEAAKLAQGFDVVTDISALRPSNEEGFKDLLRVKAALKLKGASQIIRVAKIPLTRLQMERISEGAGYQSDSVDSLEEAERRLDALRAESKPEP